MIKLNYPSFWQRRSVINYLLLPFSLLYAFLGFLRKFFAKQIRLPAFVICIGNVTVGGGGKTQIVIWLAKFLTQRGINFVIVTRGYKGNIKKARLVKVKDDPYDIGDESSLLSFYGPVIVAPKLKEIIPIINRLKPSIIIFDDGMQNPYYHKDFTVLAIDPLRALGNNLLIPAGPLRESSAKAINKADLILVVGNKPLDDPVLTRQITASNKAFYQARIKISNNLDKKLNYIAFTGIANPDKFFLLLRESNFNIIEEISYPDHYDYPLIEFNKLIETAKDKQCKLITTKKDYIKLRRHNNIICVDIELEFAKKQALEKFINDQIIEKTKIYN